MTKVIELKIFVLIGVVFFMLIVASCTKEQKSMQLNVDPTIESAKRIDTPTPIGFSLFDFSKQDPVSILHYRGKLSIANVIDFYLCDMERLGWALINFSTEKEGLLVCNKNKKYCAIRIEASTNTSYPTNIILYIKEYIHEQENTQAFTVHDINSKPLTPMILLS